MRMSYKQKRVKFKPKIKLTTTYMSMPTTTFDDTGRMPKVVKQTGAQAARFLRLCASNLK